MKAYTVGIPNIPMFPNKKVKAFVIYISKLDGFIGFHPHYPEGTLVLFRTKNEAIKGRNLIRTYDGYNGAVGNNICEIDIDDKYRSDNQ